MKAQVNFDALGGGGSDVEFIIPALSTTVTLQKNDIVVFPYTSTPNFPTSGTYDTLYYNGGTALFLITASSSSITSGGAKEIFLIRCGNNDVVHS